MRNLMFGLAASLMLASPAMAQTVLSDNFDAENGGNTALNYTGFANFSILGNPGATVDILHNGDFGLTCAGGSGSCVDLDGSTGESGSLVSAFFTFNPGDIVSLMFDLSGNQRGAGSDAFLGGFLFGTNTSLTNFTSGGAFAANNYGAYNNIGGILLPSTILDTAGFQTYNLSFTAVTGGTVRSIVGQNYLGIAPGGAGDNQGPLLDNLSLSITPGAVPEPATWMMMILGFGLIGSAMRRRKAIPAGLATA
jgi:PEP-CTERM motif